MRASVAVMTSELSNKPATSANGQPQAGSLWTLIRTIMAVLGILLAAIVVTPPRGVAFASVKAVGVGYRNNLVNWKTTNYYDTTAFTNVAHGLAVRERGLVVIGMRHSNCSSDIAFKVYVEEKEVASVFDYTCGLFSNGITTTYVQTILVNVNDTLSVTYVGGGVLCHDDSFMDVLLLPPSTTKAV